MGAPSSTTIFHRVLSSYCQGRGRLSQRGGHDDYRVFRRLWISVDYWENLLEGMPDYRDCCSNYFWLEQEVCLWFDNNGCQCLYYNKYYVVSWYGFDDWMLIFDHFILSNFIEMFFGLFLMFLIVFRILFHSYHTSFNSKLYFYYDWNIICLNRDLI